MKPPPIPTYEVGDSVLAVRKVTARASGGQARVNYFKVFRFQVVGENLSAKWRCIEPVGEDLGLRTGRSYKNFQEACDACRRLCREHGLRFGVGIRDGLAVRTKASAMMEAIGRLGT